MAMAGAQGRARSSATGNTLANELAKREMELAQYGGQLKSQGLQTGLNAESGALGDLSGFVNQDYNARVNAANQKYGTGVSQMLANNQYDQNNAMLLPNALSQGLQTAGSVFNIADTLTQRQMQNQLPIGGFQSGNSYTYYGTPGSWGVRSPYGG
jgi:hypothetical protein